MANIGADGTRIRRITALDVARIPYVVVDSTAMYNHGRGNVNPMSGRDGALPLPPLAATPFAVRALLRQPGTPTPTTRGKTAPATDPTIPDADERLLCAFCRHPVTSQSRRIAVSGSHRHVFANPRGLVFAIGCFSAAPGCRCVGDISTEFSWFPGTAWQIACCAVCGEHLGWRYAGLAAEGFFGLILDRLAGPDAASA